MDSVIFVRHGDYSSFCNSGLTDKGKVDIGALARIIGSSLEGSFYLASSGLPRTNESAEITKGVIGWRGSVEVLGCLNYQDGILTERHAAKISGEIKERSSLANNLILFTHLGVAQGMPRFLSERSRLYFSFPKEVKRAQAVYCDFVRGDSTLWTPAMAEGISEVSRGEAFVPESHQYTVQPDFFDVLARG